MKDLLEFIIQGLVDQPKEVKITQESQDDQEILNLTVASQDMGKVIGKNGQIIRAIRTLLRTGAFKKGKKVQLILEESQPPTPKVKK